MQTWTDLGGESALVSSTSASFGPVYIIHHESGISLNTRRAVFRMLLSHNEGTTATADPNWADFRYPTTQLT